LADRRARFEALWRAHHDAVMAFALRRATREQACDVVEETFLAAWRRLDASGRVVGRSELTSFEPTLVPR